MGNRGRKFSDEHKQKLSVARVGRFKGKDNPNAKPMSEESKEKLRKSKRVKSKLSEDQVLQIKTMLKIGWYTMQEIAEYCKTNKSNVQAIKEGRLWK